MRNYLKRLVLADISDPLEQLSSDESGRQFRLLGDTALLDAVRAEKGNGACVFFIL